MVDFNIESQIFRSCLLKVEPKFDIAKGDRRVLNSIFAWIWRRDNINVLGLDYDKGFYLYGPLGRGKTMTMLATRKYMNSVFARHKHMQEDYRLKAWWKTASELANIYAADGQPALMQYTATGSGRFGDGGRSSAPTSESIRWRKSCQGTIRYQGCSPSTGRTPLYLY